MEDLKKMVADLEAERDYYRNVAERLGRNASTDADGFSQMVQDLCRREIKLQQSQKELEETIEKRIAEFVKKHKELSESVRNYDSMVKLKESEARLNLLLKNSSDSLVIINSDGSQRFVSPGAERITGYPIDELEGRAIDTLIHPDDLSDVMAAWNEAVEYPEKTVTVQYRHIHKTKEWVFSEAIAQSFLAEPAINGVIASVRDITERKRAETDKTRLLLRQRAILDNLPMMAWLKDTDSRLEMINEPYASACGYTVDECIGKTDLDLFPEEMARGYMADDRDVCFSGKKKQVEEKISTPDGMKWHLTYKTPIYNEHGVVIGTTGIAQDITARKQVEEERERLQNQLIQAQKMESVGQLAGGVAHEFNNMLGVILGHAEMAMGQIDPTDMLYADLEQIQMAAGRSADITRQLLAFARKQAIALKVLDLNETIEKLLNMLRRLIGENIDLTWKPASNLWVIKADPSQIDQILTNLCVNARDAISGVGRITVELGNSKLDDTYCATHIGVPGEYVRLAVSDTGCGIDQQTMSHIFEPFFTTKSVGQGTGLGLAMVYGAVKQNNGFLDVASKPGNGTVFTIYFPRHVETETTPWESGERAVAPTEGGRETVLLVEDEEAILNMITIMLQRLGYTVIGTSNPVEAIRLVEGINSEIHLLITDVIMPEMNGRDLANRLLAIKNGMKCLFTSGYTSDIITNQGVVAEGRHFIEKPFSQKKLAAKIREILNTTNQP